MIRREMAWRIFAAEYNDSTLEESGSDERSPSYLITPLGAKVNRLFAVGVITDVENVGSPEEPVWRARLSDPTGVFYMSAGQYQPEAAQVLSNINPPAFVTVIGKARTYRPEEGVLYVSIRPESVIETDENVRDQWVLEAAKALKTRIEYASEALKMAEVSEQELKNLGCPDYLAEGITKAVQHYPQVNIERYKSILVDSLQYLLPESGERLSQVEEMDEAEDKVEDNVEDKATDEAVATDEVADEVGGSDDLEEQIMDLLKGIDDESGGKGALWDEILEKATALKIEEERLEEVLNALVNKGNLYVPSFGKYMIV